MKTDWHLAISVLTLAVLLVIMFTLLRGLQVVL